MRRVWWLVAALVWWGCDEEGTETRQPASDMAQDSGADAPLELDMAQDMADLAPPDMAADLAGPADMEPDADMAGCATPDDEIIVSTRGQDGAAGTETPPPPPPLRPPVP